MGFAITSKKGFHMKFANGWGVSVQFGPGNYCDNYDMKIGHDEEKAGRFGSSSAECAVLTPSGELFAHPSFGGDTVTGYVGPERVLELMNWAASQEAK